MLVRFSIVCALSVLMLAFSCQQCPEVREPRSDKEVISYAKGGSLEIDGLLNFEVSPNSMDTEVNTTLFCEAQEVFHGLPLLMNFEPTGLAFDPPAVLTFKASGLSTPDWYRLKLYYLPCGVQGDWVAVPDSGFTIDAAAGSISFNVSHFTLYALSKD